MPPYATSGCNANCATYANCAAAVCTYRTHAARQTAQIPPQLCSPKSRRLLHAPVLLGQTKQGETGGAAPSHEHGEAAQLEPGRTAPQSSSAARLGRTRRTVIRDQLPCITQRRFAQNPSALTQASGEEPKPLWSGRDLHRMSEETLLTAQTNT